ncbi:hypothetical protein HDU76_006042 [Blyttiomyces sp. JEL0837]|nr:hypothetical protein HDU76_006042 [Blyttiomyces sp. JEL0837]
MATTDMPQDMPPVGQDQATPSTTKTTTKSITAPVKPGDQEQATQSLALPDAASNTAQFVQNLPTITKTKTKLVTKTLTVTAPVKPEVQEQVTATPNLVAHMVSFDANAAPQATPDTPSDAVPNVEKAASPDTSALPDAMVDTAIVVTPDSAGIAPDSTSMADAMLNTPADPSQIVDGIAQDTVSTDAAVAKSTKLKTKSKTKGPKTKTKTKTGKGTKKSKQTGMQNSAVPVPEEVTTKNLTTTDGPLAKRQRREDL